MEDSCEASSFLARLFTGTTLLFQWKELLDEICRVLLIRFTKFLRHFEILITFWNIKSTSVVVSIVMGKCQLLMPHYVRVIGWSNVNRNSSAKRPVIIVVEIVTFTRNSDYSLKMMQNPFLNQLVITQVSFVPASIIHRPEYLYSRGNIVKEEMNILPRNIALLLW